MIEIIDYLCYTKIALEMTYNISFQERAKLSSIILSKQTPVTIEEARKQAQWLKGKSVKNKRQRN